MKRTTTNCDLYLNLQAEQFFYDFMEFFLDVCSLLMKLFWSLKTYIKNALTFTWATDWPGQTDRPCRESNEIKTSRLINFIKQ